MGTAGNICEESSFKSPVQCLSKDSVRVVRCTREDVIKRNSLGALLKPMKSESLLTEHWNLHFLLIFSPPSPGNLRF